MKDKKGRVIPPYMEIFNPIQDGDGDWILHKPTKPYSKMTKDEKRIENIRRAVTHYCDV